MKKLILALFIILFLTSTVFGESLVVRRGMPAGGGCAGVVKQNTVSTKKDYNTTSTTWSHTVNAGTNLLLIVACSTDHWSDCPSSVTYNSVSMTSIVCEANNSYGTTSVWRLVAPATGSNTVQVNYSSTEYFGCGAVSFECVDQSTPVSGLSSTHTSGTSATRDITTSSGDMVFGHVGINGNKTSSLAVTVGTENWELDDFGGGSSCTGGGATNVATGASTTVTWTWTGSADLSVAAFCIEQSL